MTGGRIDLVNLTGTLKSFELAHNQVCRAMGVCQCKDGAAPSLYLAAHSALTNRPEEYALAPSIIEARNAGELRIKQRPTKTKQAVTPVESAPTTETSTRSRRSVKDQA
jgi:hypothetical protein